jgi:hypothetical protein
VDRVHVWAVNSQGTSMFLGVDDYGAARGDVGAFFGSRFTNSAFNLSVGGLAPDTYQVTAYARSMVTGTFNHAQTATVTIPVPNVIVSLDVPGAGQTVAQTFALGGWAVDLAHPSTAGVSFLHVYAFPSDGSPPIYLGAPATGVNRPDIAAIYGAQFAASGWSLTASLPPGGYTLVCYPWSTVVQGFRHEAAVTRVIYVQ